MAYEINDLKRILTLVLFAIPMIASMNINCSGKAFHCVNSTHFMICVDLGGGVSITIDDFVIPCPATTVCHPNNIFECDFPEIEVTTPPLQVIDIYKQSDTSETTLVTTSVTAPTATSEILSVFKENVTATTLPIPEDATPVFKLEVLEDIKNPTRGNSENTTETNIQVNSSFMYTTNEIFNDKQTSNKTITTSATDNNKNLEPVVETSIHKAVNTSLTDKTKSIDTVTSVIGLINLISTDHPTLVSLKPSSDVFTSLDNLYDNIATTTEQYSTKKVIIQGENVTETIHNQTIPTEIIFGETSVITDEVSTTPVINMFTEKDINYSYENINRTDSDNQIIVKQDSLGKSNSTTELVPETTTEYLAPVKIDNISEPVTEVPSPQTTTDKTIVPFKLVDLIPVDIFKEKVPSTKSSSDYLNKLNDNIVTTINQNSTNQKTILSDIPVTTEVINTTPILNTNIQNVNKTDINNNFFTKLNSTVEITTTEKLPERNTTYFTAEPITVPSLQITTEKTLVPITQETNIIYTRATTPTSEDLIENYSRVKNHTTATQPFEIITTTDSSIKITYDLYQLNRELNQTLVITQNNTAYTMNTTETFKTMYNASTKDTIDDKSKDPTLLPPTTIKYPAVKIATTEAIQNEFTVHATEVVNELQEMKGSVNEPYTTNVKNDTLLYHATNWTVNTTENVETAFNVLTDMINNKNTEPTLFSPTTIKHPANEISSIETKQNEFIERPVEATSELPATNIDNIETNKLPRVQTIPTPYNVTSDAVTNTTVKDLISQSDIVTNSHIGFTPDISELKASDGYTSIDQPTTQKVTIYPETKIPGSLNLPQTLGSVSLQDSLNADQWTTTIADQDVVSMTTTYLNNIENSATTPFPGDVTENNSFSDINKAETIAAINKINPQDVLPNTNYYVTELTSTTPNIVQTSSISLNPKTLQQVSTNTPELVNIYSVSMTDYKIETSTMIPVDLADATNAENVKDIPIKTLPTQELALAIQKNYTVNQLNTTSTTTETISDLLPSTITTAGYAVLNTKDIDSNRKRLKDSVNTEPIIYEVEANADVNITETVNPINGIYTDTSPTPPYYIMKDEDFTTVPVFDIINSSVNAMPNGIMQPSSSYPSLTKDYVKTTQSQDPSAYESATDNISDYNFGQVEESVNQKTSEAIVSSAETKVMNSFLATPSTHNLPIIINTENVEYVGTEAPLLSSIVLEHMNPTKATVNYVAEKTNDYILSTEAILTQLYRKADSSSSSVSSLTPHTAAPPDGRAVTDNNKITTIVDSAFTMSSTQMPPKFAADDDNIEITTEYPLPMSKEIEAETVKYNIEPSLPISRVSVDQIIMKTEPTHTTKDFTQTTPLAVIVETNQDVLPELKTTVLPHKILSVVNNIPQSTPALHTATVTVAQITSEPTPKTIAQTTPSLATIGETNQNVIPKTKDLPHNVLSLLNNNISQSMSVLHTAGVTVAQITAEPSPTTNTFAQTKSLLATISGMNQDLISEIKTTDLPHNDLSMLNKIIPQSTSPLHIAEVPAAQITSDPIPTTNTFAQTMSSLAMIGRTNQDVIPGTKTKDWPQNVLSVVKNNSPQSMPAVYTAASQITAEPTPTTNTYVQTKSSLATIGGTNQDVIPDIKTTDMPQNVSSVINNNVPQSTPALLLAGVTEAQVTSEPILITNTVAQTTPSLATIGKTNSYFPRNVLSAVNNNIPQSTPAPHIVQVTVAQITSQPSPTTNTFVQTTPSFGAIDKTNHNVLPEIKTTDLPQYGVPTVNNYNPVVSDITTKTVIVPDFMTETIKVDGDKVSRTSSGDTISSDITSSNPTVDSNYGAKSVKNIIDHESIVIGNTSKNNAQNKTTTKSVDINKAEIVNHTQSDWIRPNVNIDVVQIKESSIEAPETSESSVKQSRIVPQNKNLPSDSSIIPQIKPIDVKTVDIIDFNITAVTPSPPYVSIALRNYTQPKTAINKDNKKLENDSSVNENIKTFYVGPDSKNDTDGYNITNTKANITTSYYNLSQQNSTMNDELEQHLISTNHTITAEIQSHLNESDKQSNKTNYELTFNGTSTHNSNLTTRNAAGESKGANAITGLLFNCANHTRGKYADNKDCRKFYTCIGNLQPMLGTCPNNTVFSEINKQCTKNLSHCVRNNQFHCLFEGRFSDFFKDNIYYICVKNRIHGFIRYTLQCQNDYHLNKQSVKCEKNEELSTQSISSVSETNDESKPESKLEKIISTDNFECENEGKFPHSKDCNKYYVCTKIKNVYRRKIKKCASDEVYDKKKKKCVESDSGEC